MLSRTKLNITLCCFVIKGNKNTQLSIITSLILFYFRCCSFLHRVEESQNTVSSSKIPKMEDQTNKNEPTALCPQIGNVER